MKSGLLILLCGILVLTGCATIHAVATGTPYQPFNVLTGGYSETQLAPDLVRIVFRGNSSTRKERAEDMALLRAADLSLAEGFPYFVVRQEEDEGQQSTSDDLTISMPKIEMLVQFRREKTSNLVVYDSAFLARALRVKYGLN